MDRSRSTRGFGADDEARFRQGVRALMGKQKAGFAGQNVDVNDGSAVAVRADAAYLGELDAHTIRANAAREAAGFKASAEIMRKTGQATAAQAYAGAASTALGTFSALQQKYGW